jgi:hypothetical protein
LSLPYISVYKCDNGMAGQPEVLIQDGVYEHRRNTHRRNTPSLAGVIEC